MYDEVRCKYCGEAMPERFLDMHQRYYCKYVKNINSFDFFEPFRNKKFMAGWGIILFVYLLILLLAYLFKV